MPKSEEKSLSEARREKKLRKMLDKTRMPKIHSASAPKVLCMQRTFMFVRSMVVEQMKAADNAVYSSRQ